MKKRKAFYFFAVIAAFWMAAGIWSCADKKTQTAGFVRVSPEGEFLIGDSVYRFVGANLWYAPILASDGPWNDSTRLARELDVLQDIGVTNLRILAGAEGPDSLPHHLWPQLQTAPGVYNEALLVGLDRVIADLEKRDMKAVIYLTNAWEWSGGYGSYLQWAGEGVAPVPGIDGYDEYVNHVSQFVLNDSARRMAVDNARVIISRVNTVTGKPYSESPAIMAWQICNEPRSFSEEGKDALESWIYEMAAAIKEEDPNHLVSTGSEGSVGCQMDIDLWTRIHSSPLIDYAIIHLWPTNWGWASRDSVEQHIENACQESAKYINDHISAISVSHKPLVIEEFGYPRDGFSHEVGSTVSARDRYYDFIFRNLQEKDGLAGVNFWGWNGMGRADSLIWHRGADYLCDPAHEPQGMYGVFDTDTTTISIIRKAAKKLKDKS